MDSKKIGLIAAVVVLIVIIAGAAVVFTGDDDDDDDKETYQGIQLGCNLWVYGNANGDDYIDQKDVDLLEKIIAGTEKEQYITIYDGYNASGADNKVSLADANGDGKITSDDVTKVKEIIAYQQKYAKAVSDGTVSTFTDKLTLYYENCDLEKVTVSLPVQHLGVVYYTNSEVVRLLGATDRVVLSDNTTIDNHKVMLPEYQRADITNVGNTRFALNEQTLLQAYKDQGMTALFTGSASTYSPGLEEKVNGYIDVIRLPAWEDNNFMAGTLTLGYILGSTDTAYSYIDWATGIINKISNDLMGSELTDIICAKGRADVLTTGNGNGSGRSEITEWAGANNLVTSITPVTSEYPEIKSEWALSVNPSAIVLSGSCGYEKYTDAQIKSAMDDVYAKAVETYAGTDAAKNGKVYIITDDIMTGPAAIVGMAYLANIMHPDLTKNIDADAIFQQYVDQFGLGSDYKVANHISQFVNTTGDHDDDDSTYQGIQLGCNLWVYGNANGDDYIDEKDVELLEKIVAGTEKEQYITIYDGYNASGADNKVSLADANGDGKITSDDVTKVKEIIAYQQNYAKAVSDGTLSSFTDKLTLYYENCDLEKVSVSLPVQHLGVVYYTNSEVVRLLGATDRVVLSDNTTINNHKVMLPEYQRADITNVGNTRFALNEQTLLQSYRDQGMTALFTGSASTYSPGLEDKVQGYIDVIRLPAWEDNNFMAGTLTLGYILGSTDTAYEYIDWATGIISKISKDLSGHDLTDIICAKGRADVLTTGNGNGSGRSEITEWAGANNLVTSITPVTSEYPELKAEWILSVNPSAIVLSGSCGYEKYTEAQIKSAMDDVYAAALETYAGTDAAKNGKIYIITDDIMTGPAAIVGMAYLANILHPELTKNIDADAIFQQYVDKFGLGSDYQVSDHISQFVNTTGEHTAKGWYKWDPTMIRVDGSYSNCTPAFMSIAEDVYQNVYGAIPDHSGITLDQIPSEYLYKYSDYTSTVEGKLVVKTFDNTSTGKTEAFVDKTINFTPTTVVAYTDAYVDTIYMIYCDYYGETAHSGNSPKAEAATWSLCSVMPSSVATSLQKNYGLTVPDTVKLIGTTKEDLTSYAGSLSADDKVIVLMTEYNIRSTSTSGWWDNNKAIEKNCSNMQFIYILSNSPAMVLSTMEMIGEVIGCTNTETMMTSIMAEIYVMQKAIDDSGAHHVFYVETAAKKSVASNTLMGAIFADILKMKNVVDDDSLMGGTISDEEIVKLQPDVIAFYKADSRSDDECMRAA